jgi:predicted nucleic acid-binding protein
MRMKRIYLDACCLNRPFDDQSQDRIRLEAEAVILILAHIESGEWSWIGSEILLYEIEQTPDQERRARVLLLTKLVKHTILVGDEEVHRAEELEALGLSGYDALHLACAEAGRADVLLTTDMHFEKIAARSGERLQLAVKNPLVWLKGMMDE